MIDTSKRKNTQFTNEEKYQSKVFPNWWKEIKSLNKQTALYAKQSFGISTNWRRDIF